MTWDDLDDKREETTAQQMREAHEAKANALRQATARALQPAKQTELKEYLRALAYSYSYTSGRSAEDVAFSEGRRWLAIELLKMGEVTDD